MTPMTTIQQLRRRLQMRNGIDERAWFVQEQITTFELLNRVRSKQKFDSLSAWFDTREEAEEYAFMMNLKGHNMKVKNVNDN
jgi:hypothetical protein